MILNKFDIGLGIAWLTLCLFYIISDIQFNPWAVLGLSIWATTMAITKYHSSK